jgi:GNAT superfamily N-acetyltransferase
MMRVIDMTDEYKNLYFACLEDWSDEMKEAGNHKELWYEKMKGKGLGVKLALDDNGHVGGMIHYLPIEYGFAEGKDVYFIPCIWVHGHKEGRGNFQKKGMGKALLKAAEQDARERGAKGMVAWGLSLPFFMSASWFEKQGYKKADKQGEQVLLWKPFEENAQPPKWFKEKKKPKRIAGKVAVAGFLSGWCPAMNIVFERAKRACSELGENVVFQAIDTFDRKTYLKWGIDGALFIDGKKLEAGPPPSYEDIKNKIGERVKKLSKR